MLYRGNALFGICNSLKFFFVCVGGIYESVESVESVVKCV